MRAAQLRPGFDARRRSKYGAIRTEVDGIVFASKREATRYSALKMLQRAGEITELTLQPRFALDVNGVHVCTYVGDFQYRSAKSGRLIWEDAKGVETIFKLKRLLMQAVHGIDVVTT